MPDLTAVKSLATEEVDPTGEKSVSGVALLTGDRCALTGQTAPLENDIWVVAAGAWTRSGEAWAPGVDFYVTHGTYSQQTWQLTNATTPTIGVDTLTFGSVGRAYPDPGAGIDATAAGVWGLSDSGVLAGTYDLFSATINSEGRITDAESGSLGSSYIEGLGLEYVSDTQVKLGAGAAHIPGISRVIEVDTPITTNMLSGALVLAYAYLYETNGVGQLELSQTAPAATPYFGSARTKTGDDTRRYLGMLKNDSDGKLLPFESEVFGGNSVLILYSSPENSGKLVAIADPATTTPTLFGLGTVNSSGGFVARLVSPACRVAICHVSHNMTENVSANIGWPLDAASNAAPLQYDQDESGHHTPPMRLSPDQEIYYHRSGGTVDFGLTVRVRAYYERR